MSLVVRPQELGSTRIFRAIRLADVPTVAWVFLSNGLWHCNLAKLEQNFFECTNFAT